MSVPIRQTDLVAAARQFALPQIRIINPRLVISLGLVTFNALRQASNLAPNGDLNSAIESPFNIGQTTVWCQTHTGRLVNRNKGGVDRVSRDWLEMRDHCWPETYKRSEPHALKMKRRTPGR